MRTRQHDWYSLNITQPVVLNATVYWRDFFDDIDIYLYAGNDFSRALTFSAAVLTSFETIQYNITRPGLYTLRVNGWSIVTNDTIPYTLVVSQESKFIVTTMQMTLVPTGINPLYPATVEFTFLTKPVSGQFAGTVDLLADVNTTVRVRPIIRVSSLERYEAGGNTNWRINTTGFLFVTFFRQFLPVITVEGLPENVSLTVDFIRTGRARSVSFAGTWSEWTDANTPLKMVRAVETSADERYLLLGEAVFIVDKPIDLRPTYLHQLKVILTLEGTGAGRVADVTYYSGGDLKHRLGVSGSFTDWMDSDTLISASEVISVSSGERLVADRATQRVRAGAIFINYTPQVLTRIVPSGLSPSAPLTVRFVQGAKQFEDHTTSVWSGWLDVGSILEVDPIVMLSPSERFVNVGEARWTIRAPQTIRLNYIRQHSVELSLDVEGEAPILVNYVDGNRSRSVVARGGWRGWADSGSLIQVSGEIEASPAERFYLNPKEWRVNSAIKEAVKVVPQVRLSLVVTGLESSGGARLFVDGVHVAQIQSGETSIWVNKGAEVSVDTAIQLGPGERLIQNSLVRRVLSEPTAIALQYHREVLVEARLVDSEGAPLPEREGSLTLVNEDGVEVQLRSGSSTWLREGVWMARSIRWGGEDLPPGSVSRFRVESPGRIAVYAGVYTLRLVALDALGLPLQGVLVDVILPGGRTASIVTQSNGEAVVPNVVAGSYTAVGRYLGQVASVQGRVGGGVATMVFMLSPNVALLFGFIALLGVLGLGFFVRKRT